MLFIVYIDMNILKFNLFVIIDIIIHGMLYIDEYIIILFIIKLLMFLIDLNIIDIIIIFIVIIFIIIIIIISGGIFCVVKI